MPRVAHKPTDKTRAEVSALAGFGVQQDNIAIYIGIGIKTLRKYYRDELDTGLIKANAAVARALYSRAIDKDDVAAQIFWLKARAGWSERVNLNHLSTDGSMTPRIIKLEPEYGEPGNSDT